MLNAGPCATYLRLVVYLPGALATPAVAMIHYRATTGEAVMSQTITAIYEDGILRPLTPLELPDRTEVRLTVEAAPELLDADVHTQRRQVDMALMAAGLMAPRAPADPALHPLTDEERAALSRRIPAGRPLSEIILEERDGR